MSSSTPSNNVSWANPLSLAWVSPETRKILRETRWDTLFLSEACEVLDNLDLGSRLALQAQGIITLVLVDHKYVIDVIKDPFWTLFYLKLLP